MNILGIKDVKNGKIKVKQGQKLFIKNIGESCNKIKKSAFLLN